MSMVANLLRVTEVELLDYQRDSSKLEERIYDNESEIEDENLIDIDKTWDAIIFLLTGQAPMNANHPFVQFFLVGSS